MHFAKSTAAPKFGGEFLFSEKPDEKRRSSSKRVNGSASADRRGTFNA
ncbi:hypothetical protein CPter91_1784 [Collimonas pratensis]|uniref:Uncharacterized protein n=1 Tax=Collimonas pratensis TaxID=279113 RepID=A0A127Q2C0_9BURK|nr:hypothetical protein CPter91_1784 [Collimonas pratensis]